MFKGSARCNIQAMSYIRLMMHIVSALRSEPLLSQMLTEKSRISAKIMLPNNCMLPNNPRHRLQFILWPVKTDLQTPAACGGTLKAASRGLRIWREPQRARHSLRCQCHGDSGAWDGCR